MGMSRSRARARALRRVVFLFAAFALMYCLLPLDNTCRLAVRRLFHTPRQHTFSREQLLSVPPPYPVDLATDVALVIKSGFGTRDRLPGTLQLLDGDGDADSKAPIFGSILLVGDFATQPGQHYRCNGEELPVHDVVGRTIEQALRAGLYNVGPRHPSKVGNYSVLQDAIANNNDDLALSLSHQFGWELDALKFISSLQLAYDTFPDKKWYILSDDDTYLVRPALRQFLGQFHPDCEHYLGNAVGGWEGRFAHGGSAILLSQGAMRRLFVDHPGTVAAAHRTALRTGMGDSLLANTLMKVGIYVKEEHSLFFNGETPETTKIRPDRFCLPVLTFHSLRAPGQTLAVDRVFRKRTQPPLWRDIWTMYGGPSLESFVVTPHRVNWDHVGSLDEHTKTVPGVKRARDCQKSCEARREGCMAWRWEPDTHLCHQSPWMIVGSKAEGKISGLNLHLVRRLGEACDDEP